PLPHVRQPPQGCGIECRADRGARARAPRRPRLTYALRDACRGVLGHERLGELLLRLHDVEAVLLEHERGGFALAERLAFQHEERQAMLESAAPFRAWRPQVHMPHSGSERPARPLSERPDPLSRSAGGGCSRLNGQWVRATKGLSFGRAAGGPQPVATLDLAPCEVEPRAPDRGRRRIRRERPPPIAREAAALCYAADCPVTCGSK